MNSLLSRSLREFCYTIDLSPLCLLCAAGPASGKQVTVASHSRSVRAPHPPVRRLSDVSSYLRGALHVTAIADSRGAFGSGSERHARARDNHGCAGRLDPTPRGREQSECVVRLVALDDLVASVPGACVHHPQPTTSPHSHSPRKLCCLHATPMQLLRAASRNPK